MAWNFKAAFKALFGPSMPKTAGGLLAGVTIGSQRAPRRGSRELMLAYREQPWLRAIVQRVATDVASVPLRLLAPAKPSANGLVSRSIGAGGDVRRKMLNDGLASGQLVQIEEHPFLALLNNMNPALRAVGSMTVTQAFIDLKGEAFWVLERNAAGQAIEAWPVPPHWVTETPSSLRDTFRMSAFGWNKEVPESDVVWFRQPDLENPYARGSGIGEALADEIDVDEYAAKHVRDWFFNGGRPSAFVSLDGASEDEVERFEERWRQKYQGLGRANQIHFTNAPIGYEDLSHTFKDQELLSIRQFQADLMRQTFGIPPEILGILQNSNRATIDSSYYLYSRGVLVPRLVMLCDALQGLAREWDSKLIVDFLSPVPEDMEFKKAAMVALPSNYTVNEHRALAGQMPIDGGEELYSAAPSYAPQPMALEFEPPFAKSLGVWKASKTINEVADAAKPEVLDEKTRGVMKKGFKSWSLRILQKLGVENAEEILSKESLTQAAIQESSDKITKTNETTKQKIRDTLEAGVMEGEGIEKLRKRIESVFDEADASRARTIARTEVVGSLNKANMAAYVASGVVTRKEWLSVQDGQTRDEHRSLDGQIVGLDASFKTNEGNQAPYPGAFGKPELDINCRCAMLPVTELSKAGNWVTTKEQRVEEWKMFDKAALSWEAQMVAALQDAYEVQREATLEAFDATFGKSAGRKPRASKRRPRAKQLPLVIE